MWGVLDKLSDRKLSGYSVSAILPRTMVGEASLFVRTEQFRKQAAAWLAPLKRGENTAVLFFPKTDRQRRLQQLIGEKQLLAEALSHTSRYVLQIVDIDAHNIEDREDVEIYLAEQLNIIGLTKRNTFSEWIQYFQDKEIRLILLLPLAEKFVLEQNGRAFGIFSNLVDSFIDRISVISFFEIDLLHSTNVKLLPASTRLIQNVLYYPLYSKEDTQQFMRYLAHKWDAKLTHAQKERIWKLCGGHFWLAKQAMRELAALDDAEFEHEAMNFRLRTIFNSLSNSEQSFIEKAVLNKKNFTSEETESMRYLQKMGCVDKSGKCTIDLIAEYIHQQKHLQSTLTTQGGQLVLNSVPLRKVLSKQEYKVFQLLLEQKGQIVTRDDVGKRMWPNDTEKFYSDWAIDRLIARIRQKMAELSLSPALIRTHRGKGYVLNLNS
jgi:DNA-binding winged helix-turn-helix (wHTH) protein